MRNPHDKLFKEIWSNLDNTRSFLKHFLPDKVLQVMDLSSLEICKDSFVEKELSDYYSDMLYKVMLSGNPGYVYVLFEHIWDLDLLDRLPGILGLMKDLMQKETGLQYLETTLRYLFNTVDNISPETIKDIAEQAISEKAGEYIMTLAERLRKEGEIRGELKGRLEGKLEGLADAIELGMTLKFPDQCEAVMAGIKKIKDIDILLKIKDTIKIAKDVSEILMLL